jgi:hypothetical protein
MDDKPAEVLSGKQIFLSAQTSAGPSCPGAGTGGAPIILGVILLIIALFLNGSVDVIFR